MKDEARRLIDSLPEGAGWADLDYAVYVRSKIERGRLAARANRSRPQAEVERELIEEFVHQP